MELLVIETVIEDDGSRRIREVVTDDASYDVFKFLGDDCKHNSGSPIATVGEILEVQNNRCFATEIWINPEITFILNANPASENVITPIFVDKCPLTIEDWKKMKEGDCEQQILDISFSKGHERLEDEDVANSFTAMLEEVGVEIGNSEFNGSVLVLEIISTDAGFPKYNKEVNEIANEFKNNKGIDVCLTYNSHQ